MEKETLVLEGVGGGGGGCILKIFIAKRVQFSYVIIIIIIFWGRGKVLIHHTFLASA